MGPLLRIIFDDGSLEGFDSIDPQLVPLYAINGTQQNLIESTCTVISVWTLQGAKQKTCRKCIVRQSLLSKGSLDDSNFAGNIKRFMVWSETNVRLLLSIGSDEGVDFQDCDFVHVFNGLFDGFLVRAHINDERESVMVFNLFHGTFSSQGEFDDGVLVEFVPCRDGLARVQRLAGQFQSLGSVKVDSCSPFYLSLLARSIKHCLGGFSCLLRRLYHRSIDLHYISQYNDELRNCAFLEIRRFPYYFKKNGEIIIYFS